MARFTFKLVVKGKWQKNYSLLGFVRRTFSPQNSCKDLSYFNLL